MEKVLLATLPNPSLTAHQVNQANTCFYYLNKVTSFVNYGRSQRNYKNSEKQQTSVHQCMDTHKHVRTKNRMATINKSILTVLPISVYLYH